MKTFEVVASFWFFGDMSAKTIVKRYTAENEKAARQLFDEDFCAMLGTGHIITIEEVEEEKNDHDN